MEIQGKYVKNMRKYKGTIIVLIVCMIFAYLYAHVDKKEYFYNRTVDVGKYANTGVICEKKLTQDVYSTEKSLDGIQVKTQNVGDCTNIKIKITILDKKTNQNLRQKEISVSDFENDKFATIKFKKITNCKNRMLQLLIEEIGADYGNGVTFYQENGNLIGRLISRKIDMEYRLKHRMSETALI